MQLNRLSVRPLLKQEESRYVQLLDTHHYLGAIPKIGETLWYVAIYEAQWIALISFSAAALKCTARDHWIGWRYRHQTGRLKLIANNNRFLILPEDGLQTQIMSAVGASHRPLLCPKKVGALPVGKGSDEVKQSNEIKFAPLRLAPLPIRNKAITRDALHTQTEFAHYLVEQRKAHYFLSVKANQPTLLEEITVHFSNENRRADYEDRIAIEHGRIEIRRIWTSSKLNDSVKFPHAAQVYRIEREITDKKSGQTSLLTAYGITRRTNDEASPQTILQKVRGHWSVEVSHYIIDWVFDEDRSTIRTGFGPENMTRLRRFAIGLIKSKGEKGISRKMRTLN